MRQRIRKRPWMIPALLLVLVFAMGLLVEAIRPLGVFAAHTDQRVSDPPTNASQDYEDALGSTSSTRYNGRVWADKTVYTSDATIGSSVEGGGTEKIEIGEDDFLISYSLMAATTVVEGQSLVPLDVVFVIDLSDSMKGDKIKETVVALNQSVHTLMMGNPDTRIGVVTYNNEAQVLLPLDHYTKVEGSENYFTLSETGDCLDVSVVNSSGQVISESAPMGQWTNIHMGIDAGMELLLSVKDVTTPDKEERYPALMLMSDGAPTASGSDDTDWWQPTGMSGDGKVNRNGIDAMKSIMNAAYQKQQVSKHYGVEAKVYTVGVGVEYLDTDGPREIAKLTLNPTGELESDDGYAKDLMEIWNAYKSGQEVSVGNDKRTYTFKHPTKEDEITSLFYNDAYFSATNPEDIAEAFQQVLNQIVVSGAVPTEVGSDPSQSGYITYVDPIGQYMEITAMEALVWKNNVYYISDTITNGNTTTYIFEGRMTSPVYGQHEFSEILVTVTTDSETNDQILEVKIPAALIPLRTNYVTLNEDGTVKKNVCENSTPLQLFYKVSLRDEVVQTVDNKNYVDVSSLSSEYVESHTNADGTIRFHPNLYTNYIEDQAGTEKTVGNAYVYFQAADTNPFYYVQKDTLVYADEECTIPATDKNGNLYVKITYYDGQKIVTKSLARAGGYRLDDIQPGDDGLLYLQAGSRCNLSDRIMDKGSENNLSGTAETYRYPIYIEKKPEDIGEGEAMPPYGNDGEKGDVLVYLGNNGVESLPVLTGDLSVSKTVTGNKGEKDRAFEFNVTMYYDDGSVETSPAPEVTETPAPTETSEATESAETLEVTVTPAPTATPEVTATPEPTATPEVTATPEPTATPEVTATPAPTATPEVTAKPESTEVLKAKEVPVSTEVPEDTVTSEVTASPQPMEIPESIQSLEQSNQRSFQAILTDKTGHQTNFELTFTDGCATFQLMDGESITIQDLPAGYTYTVTEVDPTPSVDVYNGEDYEVSSIQNGQPVKWEQGEDYTCTGTIKYNRVETVAYTNDLNVPLVDFSFTKVDGEGFDQSNLEDAILLPGAQFTLYHYTGDDWDTDSGVLLDTTQTITNWETVMTVTSDEDGVVLMKELQAGRYRLVETKAPDGYKLPKGQWNLQISRDEETELWSFTIQAVEESAMDTPAMAIAKEASGENTYYLMNYKPINPPITGGDGGEDFRIGGGLLMFTGLVLACWWMWSSPRRRSEFL